MRFALDIFPRVLVGVSKETRPLGLDSVARSNVRFATSSRGFPYALSNEDFGYEMSKISQEGNKSGRKHLNSRTSYTLMPSTDISTVGPDSLD